jgi:hypothetical protein
MKPGTITLDHTWTNEEINQSNKQVHELFNLISEPVKNLYQYYINPPYETIKKSILLKYSDDLALILVYFWLGGGKELIRRIQSQSITENFIFLNKEQEWINIIENRFHFNQKGIITILNLLNKNTPD